MGRNLRIVKIIILAAAIVLSCTVGASKLTDPAAYSHSIEVLDENRSTMITLSAASTAASAAITVLPSDICNPIATQLAEFSSYFVLILSVIFLEKYLLTIIGMITCYGLIPAGCAALLVHQFFPSEILRSIGRKLVAFGLVIVLIVPASVWVQDKIRDVYSDSIDAAVQSANEASSALLDTANSGTADETSVIDQAKLFLDDTSASVASLLSKFKNLLNRFIEATAVMVVTTCVIPIAVVLFFVWMTKTLFGFQAPPPERFPRIGRRQRDEEKNEDR